MTERRDRIRVHIAGKEFNVVGGDFQDMLAAVKQIEGRRFIGGVKAWQLPGSAEDVQTQLDASGYWLEGGQPLDDKEHDPRPSQPGPSGDRIRVLIEGHQLAVVGGSFQEMLAVVRNLPGRRFDGEQKVWEIPGQVGVIQGLIQAEGFQLEGADKVSSGPVPPAEAPDFAGGNQAFPPPFEAPGFGEDEPVPPYEPPDWWDDDTMPPPLEPTGWEQAEADSLSDNAMMAPEAAAATGQYQAGFPAESSSAVPAPDTRDSSRRDQIRIRVGGIPMVVTGGSFRQMLEVVKQIPGRRFDGDDKVWDIPAEAGLEEVRKTVAEAGFELVRG